MKDVLGIVACGAIVGLIPLFSCILVGCNRTAQVNLQYDKALIERDGTGQIIEIKSWNTFCETCYRLELIDGSMILISAENCTLIKTNNNHSSLIDSETID